MAHYGPMPQGRTALYRLLDDTGRLLYVGIGCDPDQRIKAHHGRAWWPQVAETRIEWHETRNEALRIERDVIHVESPVYNIAETGLHRKLAGHRSYPLTDAERAQWKAADTYGARTWHGAPADADA